jgi:hypothetical protein
MQIDLRPWGYAPGGYSFKCIDCPPDTDPMSQWAAKRAWRCEKHALEAKEREDANPAPAAGAPKITVDGQRVLGIETIRFAADYNIDRGPIGPIMQGCLDLVEAGLMERVGDREFRKLP